MGNYYGTTGMWYHNGTFYEVDTTHVDFFLNNPESLGFTQEEKERMCVANGLKPDATHCDEKSKNRVDIVLEILKRGNIRIRFYGAQTSVQCYDFKNSHDAKELKNCVMDGYGKCFGNIITVMDCFNWSEMINDMGWGTQIKDFIASCTRKSNYIYINNKLKTHGEFNMRTGNNENGRVLEGEEKNAVLRQALKEQGYSDSDIATMLSQSRKPIKSENAPDWDEDSDWEDTPDWEGGYEDETLNGDLDFHDKSFYEDLGPSDADTANGIAHDAYNENKDSYTFNSKSNKKTGKPIKSVRVFRNMSFRDFEPWSGAKSTYDVIIAEGKEDEMDAMLDEMYPDGLSDTELNDLLWFDSDSVFEWLGIQSNERGIPDGYEYEDDEYSSYPRARRSELGQARKAKKDNKKKKSKKSVKSGYDMSDENEYYDATQGELNPQESEGRVLEGEEKNAVLRQALKEQGYSDSDIATMLSQSRKVRR